MASSMGFHSMNGPKNHRRVASWVTAKECFLLVDAKIAQKHGKVTSHVTAKEHVKNCGASKSLGQTGNPVY